MGKWRPQRCVTGSRSRSRKATEMGFKPRGRSLRRPCPSHYTPRKFLPHGLALLVFCPADQTPDLQVSLLWNFPEASKAIHRAKPLQLCPPRVGDSQYMRLLSLGCFSFLFTFDHHYLELFTLFPVVAAPRPQTEVLWKRNFVLFPIPASPTHRRSVNPLE